MKNTSFGTNHHHGMRSLIERAILASQIYMGARSMGHYWHYWVPAAPRWVLTWFSPTVWSFTQYKPQFFWMDIIQATSLGMRSSYIVLWWWSYCLMMLIIILSHDDNHHIVSWWSSSSQIHTERLQRPPWALTPMAPPRPRPAASTPGDQVNTHHQRHHHYHDHHHPGHGNQHQCQKH